MGKSSAFEESMKGQRDKDGGAWEDDMPKKLGFDWKDAPLAWEPSPCTTTPSSMTPVPLEFPDPKQALEATPSLTSIPLPGSELAPSESDQAATSQVLGELNRSAARSLNVITSGQSAVEGGHIWRS